MRASTVKPIHSLDWSSSTSARTTHNRVGSETGRRGFQPQMISSCWLSPLTASPCPGCIRTRSHVAGVAFSGETVLVSLLVSGRQVRQHGLMQPQHAARWKHSSRNRNQRLLFPYLRFYAGRHRHRRLTELVWYACTHWEPKSPERAC